MSEGASGTRESAREQQENWGWREQRVWLPVNQGLRTVDEKGLQKCMSVPTGEWSPSTGRKHFRLMQNVFHGLIRRGSRGRVESEASLNRASLARNLTVHPSSILVKLLSQDCRKDCIPF